MTLDLRAIQHLHRLRESKSDKTLDYANLSLLDFIMAVHAKIYNEEFVIKPFHYEICDILTKCAQRKLPSGKYIVIINMPFRFSKTQILIYYMIWCFLNNDQAKFIYSSYSDKLSLKTSREVKSGLIDIFKKRASFSKEAAQLWSTKSGGGLLATTSLGSVTGFGCGSIHSLPFSGDLLIDDPIKSVDAFYETKLESVNQNLINTFWSRRNQLDTTPMILIQQRLHTKDQSHYLMEKFPNSYIRYCVKGLDENDESIFPERVSTQTLRELKQASPYTFYSQVQQEPQGLSGNFFNVNMIQIIPVEEFRKNEWLCTYFIRSWDLAGVKRETKPSEKRDWTRGILMCIDNERIYILDLKSHKGSVEENELLIVKTAKEDGWKTQITIPEDPGIGGQFLTDYFQNLAALDGYSLYPMRPVLNKQLRAHPFASCVNLGKVYMVSDDQDETRWNSAVLEELAGFPYSGFDDIVDAAADAFFMIHNVKKFI